MLLTNHFVFIHMPKTGGTFLIQALRDHAPADWEARKLDDHTPASQVPATHANLPRLGFVRNPFDWYVSWYCYHRLVQAHGAIQPGHFYSQASRNSSLSFKETMPRLMELLPPNGAGFYTAYLEIHFGANLKLVDTLRSEMLRTEFLEWLEEQQITIPTPVALAFNNTPDVNVVIRDHYSSFYDDSTRDLVLACDSELIDRFGYTFDADPDVS